MPSQSAVRLSDDFTAGHMEVEVVERQDTPGAWSVEAIDHGSEGEVYLAVFSGPEAHGRAREYAQMKYQVTA